MWHLKNDSNEILEIIESVDISAPGCRLRKPDWPITTLLNPDESLCITAYEPGTSFVVRPKENPEKHRRLPMSELCKSIQKAP